MMPSVTETKEKRSPRIGSWKLHLKEIMEIRSRPAKKTKKEQTLKNKEKQESRVIGSEGKSQGKGSDQLGQMWWTGQIKKD